jgi:PAS domain S-box-containing protein
MGQLLIVDDEIVIATQLEELLTSLGHDVLGMASSGTEAVEMASRLHPDLILMDVVMPGGMDGISAAREIKRSFDIPVIYLTAYGDRQLIERAKQSAPIGFILKPFQEEQLKIAIEIALHKHEMERRLRDSEEALRKAHDELEIRVAQRTAALAEANKRLISEIRERSRFEEALRESEKKYRALFEQSKDAIYITTLDGTILDMNPAGLELLGYSKEELRDIKAQDLSVDPADRQRFQEDIEHLGSVKNYEYQLVKKDGTTIDCLLTSTIRRRKDGSTVGYQGIIRDISDQKRAEAARRESDKRFRAVFEAAPLGITLADEDGRFLEANRFFHTMLGFRRDEIRSMNFIDITHPDDREETMRNADRVREGKTDHYIMEKQYLKKDGSTIWGIVRATAIKDPSGKIQYWIGLMEDITERKQTQQQLMDRERELEDKNRNLEEVNTALRVLLKKRDEDRRELENRFILNLKELVNPYVDKLKNEKLDEKQKAFISIIESNLEDVISPFSQRLTLKFLNFTPSELRIANLIKQGKTTKEIAHLLNLSPRTVESHRDNIRKKIGIKKKKANLRTHLLSVR